jgi:hypothetical protein
MGLKACHAPPAGNDARKATRTRILLKLREKLGALGKLRI